MIYRTFSLHGRRADFSLFYFPFIYMSGSKKAGFNMIDYQSTIRKKSQNAQSIES